MPADQYHKQRNDLMRKILKELDPIAPGLTPGRVSIKYIFFIKACQ